MQMQKQYILSALYMTLCFCLLGLFSPEASHAYPMKYEAPAPQLQYKKVLYQDFLADDPQEIAKKKNAKEDKVIPSYEYISDEETFKKYTKIHNMTPYGNEGLGFSIRLPKAWEARNVSAANPAADANQQLFGDLAQFKGPLIINARAELRIQIIQIKREIEAKHWLRQYLFHNGYSLEGEIEAPTDTVAEASYIYLDVGGISYHAYISAQIYANKVIFVHCRYPLHAKEKYSEIQKMIVRSFSLRNPIMGRIEKTSQFAMMSALKFEYPRSWTSKNTNLKTPNFLKTELHNYAEPGNSESSLKGLIRFEAVKREPKLAIKDEIERFRINLAKQFDVEYKELQNSTEITSYPRFHYAWHERYLVNFKKMTLVDHELYFYVLSDTDWYIFIMMMTPNEEDDLTNWSINTRALKLIMSSIQ